MTVEMLRATSFPRERVLGMAGTLDSSRFRNALAMAAGGYACGCVCDYAWQPRR